LVDVVVPEIVLDPIPLTVFNGDPDDDFEDDVVFVEVILVVVVFVDVVERVIGLVGKEDLLNVVVLVDVFDCVGVELSIIPPAIKFLE
jgi:hypothetical protein